MRLAKPTAALLASTTDLLSNCYVVEPTYDFVENDAVDVTSFDRLSVFYGAGYMDFKQFRDGVGAVFTDLGGDWAGLSLDHKKLVAQMYRASVGQRAEVFDSNVQKFHWREIIFQYRQVRHDRALLGMAEVTLLLPLAHYGDLGLTVETLLDRYIKFDMPDLLYYIENTPGTAYENAGFAQKAYFNTTVRDRLVSRIKWGL